MKESIHFDVQDKRFTVLVPDGLDSQIAIKSLGSGDICVVLQDLKIIKPKFKSQDHPNWYEICYYDGITETHKILARIQVDLIKDTIKPITNLPDVTGVECDTCGIKLGDIHGNIQLVTTHVKDCGGKFVRK